MHAPNDSAQIAARVRATLDRRFAQEIDSDGVLRADELERLEAERRREHFRALNARGRAAQRRAREEAAAAAAAAPPRGDRFERLVDPDGELSEEERRRRAEHARRAQLLRMQAGRVRARARRAAGLDAAPENNSATPRAQAVALGEGSDGTSIAAQPSAA